MLYHFRGNHDKHRWFQNSIATHLDFETKQYRYTFGLYRYIKITYVAMCYLSS